MKYLTTQERADAPNADYLKATFPLSRVVGTSIILLVILLCSMQCAYAQDAIAYHEVRLTSIEEGYAGKKVRFQGVPNDLTIPCTEPLPEWPKVKAVDHKGRILIVIPTLEQTNSGQKIQRRWTAITKKGECMSAVQEILLEDIEAPSLSVPEDRAVAFQQGIPAPTYVSVDNCSETTVHLKETISIQSDGNYKLRRTWTAWDDKNNSTTNSQNITIVVREVSSNEMD